jgi:hypothetical protein
MHFLKQKGKQMETNSKFHYVTYAHILLQSYFPYPESEIDFACILLNIQQMKKYFK